MVIAHCQVSKFVYDFFVCKHQSDQIAVRRQTHLSALIKNNLCSIDNRYAINGYFLRFEINTYPGINTKYKHYITKEGQRLISEDLDRFIRELFISFMQGWCYNSGVQKKGIEEFLRLYNLESISMYSKNYDRLIKYWNRSKEKKEIFLK